MNPIQTIRVINKIYSIFLVIFKSIIQKERQQMTNLATFYRLII